MIDEGTSASSVKGMDDIQLFNSLERSGGYAAEMASRIKSRKIFKRAVYVGLECLDSTILKASEGCWPRRLLMRRGGCTGCHSGGQSNASGCT